MSSHADHLAAPPAAYVAITTPRPRALCRRWTPSRCARRGERSRRSVALPCGDRRERGPSVGHDAGPAEESGHVVCA
jgi:hypothetical protein